MSHILIIRHTDTQNSKPEFVVQRQNDGKNSTSTILNTPQETIVAGRTESNLTQDLRWYLEHFLDYPYSPNTAIADRVLEALKTWGKDCFSKLFAGQARDWYRDVIRDAGLAQLVLKIASDDPKILAWPWEALRDPEGTALAHTCRIERQLSQIHDPQPLSNNLANDCIHILLIIARPFANDVGYHALSRPIVEQAQQNQWPVHIDVLRPPTFAQLRHVLHTTQGKYHIIHFDGHGDYGAEGDGDSDGKGAGYSDPPSSHVFKPQNPQGQLVFETEEGEQQAVSAENLTALLTEYRIPMMVLNACQSARIDEHSHDPFASVAAALIKAGIRSVVAMGYNLYVSGAQQFVPAFYQRLLENGDTADAVRAGRQAMLANTKRVCTLGTFPLHDWLVPVLYQQDVFTLPTKSALSGIQASRQATPDILPDDAKEQGDYGFIGRDLAIQTLEGACLRQRQAGILIHGMAGVGKTTLAQGFLQWLSATNGLPDHVVWLKFDDIRSAEYVINTLIATLFDHAATALPMDKKLLALVAALREQTTLIVWDNFESASGIAATEITANLPNQDRAILKQLLAQLRGGKSKIIITSRSPESWLTQLECYRLPLEGLSGEELWTYCNAVAKDLGLKLNRSDTTYSKLIKELDGHPLAIRAILLRLADTSASVLLAELQQQFVGATGDASTRRIFAALSLLDQGLPERFGAVLQLIGLHQRFVDIDYLEVMLKEAEAEAATDTERETVTDCFAALERGGLLHHLGQNIYRMHPALSNYLYNRHPASTTLQTGFIDFMGRFANQLAPQELHEQRGPFALHRDQSKINWFS